MALQEKEFLARNGLNIGGGKLLLDGVSGGSNQIQGQNLAGTAQEWKTLISGAGIALTTNVPNQIKIETTGTLPANVTAIGDLSVGQVGAWSANGTTTVTVTVSGHGLVDGNSVYIAFYASSGGTPTKGSYVVDVINENIFTITHGSTVAANANSPTVLIGGSILSRRNIAIGDTALTETTSLLVKAYDATVTTLLDLKDSTGVSKATILPSGATTLTGTLAVNAASITTNQTTFSVANATATTLNIGGAATTVSLGAGSGTTTVNNTLAVTLGTISTAAATGTLFASPTTLNIGGAATTVSLGAATGTTTVNNDLSVNGGDLVTNQTSFRLVNATATTLNIGGAATTVTLGAATGTTTINHDLSVNGGDLVTNQTSFNLLNATATTLNIGGVATSLNLGAATGTTTIRNTIAANGGSITTDDTSFNLVNATATTLNIGGAATSLNLGAATGTTTIANALAVNGTSISTNQTSFTMLASPTTVAIGGAATTVTIGAATGTTTINNDLAVNGGDITTTQATGRVFSTAATTDLYLGSFATSTSIGAATGSTTINNKLWLPASTTTQSSLRILPGVAPSVSNNGDIWITSSRAYTRINGVTVDMSIPDQTNNAGKLLQTDGTNTSWSTIYGWLKPTAVKTTAYTAISYELVRVNSSGGIFNVTLPSAPVDGEIVGVSDIVGSCGTNIVTIVPAGTKTIEGDASGLQVDSNGATIIVIYNSSTNNWKILESPLPSEIFPSQSGNIDRILTTDGGAPYWANSMNSVSIGATTPSSGAFTTLSASGTLSANSGTIGTNQTTFNLINTTATTLNIGGAATAVNIGAATGTATIKNASVVLDGDLQIKGGDLTTNQTSFNLINTNAVVLSIGGAATSLDIGAVSGTTFINNALKIQGPFVAGAFYAGEVDPTGTTARVNFDGYLYATNLYGKGLVSIPTTIVSTTTQTASTGNHYVMTNVALSTLTLPSGAALDDVVMVTFSNGLSTNVIARNGLNIMKLAEDLTVDSTIITTLTLKYTDATHGWILLI